MSFVSHVLAVTSPISYDFEVHWLQIATLLSSGDLLVLAHTCRPFATIIRRLGAIATQVGSMTSSFARFLWALERQMPTELALSSVILRGNARMLARLYSLGCRVSYEDIAMSAYYGHLSVVSWWAGCSRDISEWEHILESAARGGHDAICTFIHARFVVNRDILAQAAMEVANMTLLQAAVNRGFRGDASIIAKHKDLAFISAVNSMGLGVDDSMAVHYAAEAGHMTLVQALVARGCPLSSQIASVSLLSGRVDLAEWCVTHGAPLQFPMAIECALRAGSIPALDWLLDRGARECWHPQADLLAAYAGEVEVLEWMATNDLPWEASVVLTAGARAGDVAVLDWVRRHRPGLTPDELPLADATRGGMAAVKWCLDRGAVWTPPVAARAVLTPSIFRWADLPHPTTLSSGQYVGKQSPAAIDFIMSHRIDWPQLMTSDLATPIIASRIKSRFERCVADVRHLTIRVRNLDNLPVFHDLSDQLVRRIVAQVDSPCLSLVCVSFYISVGFENRVIEGACCQGAW
jgi:hypothetical protein